MTEVLVHVSRGPIVESEHRGHVAVVDAAGKLLYYAGDPQRVAYLRSSAKPLQAINVFLSGGVEKFGFSDKQIAIMCASHYAESFHKETVRENLALMGLGEDALHSSVQYSINAAVNAQQLRANEEPAAINCDCSGKHTGFLAACLAKGYDTATYELPENPVQQDVLDVLSYMFELEKEEIYLGEDGCGVPVHGVPVYNMALAFAKLANPEGLAPEYAAAAKRICKAMGAHPEMVSGTGGFCTELMRVTGGKLVGKAGAEGVYCIGVPGQSIGIAVKIADGMRGAAAATMRALTDLGLLTTEERQALAHFESPKNINGHQRHVGDIYPVYHLHKASDAVLAKEF